MGNTLPRGAWAARVPGQGMLLQFPFLLPSVNQDGDAGLWA